MTKLVGCQYCPPAFKAGPGRTRPVPRISKNLCDGCGKCTVHDGCACIKCKICLVKKGPKLLCGKCNACTTHHEAGRSFRRGDFPFRKCEYTRAHAVPPRHLLNPLPRTLGCEIELGEWNGMQEERPRVQDVTYNFEHDGSVVPSGLELVTGKMIGDKYVTGMGNLVQTIQEFECRSNDTCGFHVHVDAIDLSPEELRRVFVGFAATQWRLYGTLVAKSRSSNQFCQPIPLDNGELEALMRHADFTTWMYKYLYNIDYVRCSGSGCVDHEACRMRQEVLNDKLRTLKAHKYENAARRQALNLHSWMMRGTLEFRLKEGTTNAEDLLMWPLWCGWFVQKVSSLSDKEILWWVKKPPTLVELATTFSEGAIRMPGTMTAWVREKAAGSEGLKPRDTRKVVVQRHDDL